MKIGKAGILYEPENLMPLSEITMYGKAIMQE